MPRTKRKDSRILTTRPMPMAGPRARVEVNLAESPLSWLRARRMISDRQFDAGEALRRDYELSGLPPCVTMRWDAAPRAKAARGAPLGIDPTLAQLDAKRRFDCAVAAVGGGLDAILWRIVCAGEGLRDAEGALGWPTRAGKVVLLIALDRLADHYRLPGGADATSKVA